MAEEKAKAGANEIKNMLFDPQKLGGKIEYSVSEVECPELNELMGITEGNVVIKVRQATLDEFLRSQTGDSSDQVLELSSKLQEAVLGKNPDKIAETLSEVYGFGGKLLPQTSVQINFCEKCIVEPELSRDQIIKISKFFPFVISKLANEILRLTNVGAIKKNS